MRLSERRIGYRIVSWLSKLTLIGVVLVLASNIWITKAVEDLAYFDTDSIPSSQVGLVLGTSKLSPNGKPNLYFRYRMEAAALLFKKGKVKHLLLSGNNDSRYYNEPLDMQKALLELDIPEQAMTLDYAGYRTYDSIVRSKEVFHSTNITIISQHFHNVRALYIAQGEGIHAVSFAARDVPPNYSYPTLIREYLARPKAIWDLLVVKPVINLATNQERSNS